MKLLGQLLVWGSLAVGALAAATAYLASLDAPNEQLVGLTLAAPAGVVELPDGTHGPIAEKDEKISESTLLTLRKAGVRNLRVKEFDFGRWRGKWYFAASLVVLLLGGRITRQSSKSKIAAEAKDGHAKSPKQTLQAIAEAVDRLRADLTGMPDAVAQTEAVVERLDELQKTHMTALVDAREALVATLGLAGYAGLMDAYASAERQINRAWSAAADGADHEMIACLEEASVLFEQARRKL
ncbi:MAG: hypothetical protein V3R99_12540 [Thermoguttaceae bacterium]